MVFFGVRRRGRIRNHLVFAESLLASGLGIVCGLLLFPREASLIGLFLCVFAQTRTVEALLDRNRIEILEKGKDPGQANRAMALSLFVLFLGILITYMVCVQLAPADQLEHWFDRQLGNFIGGSITDVEFGTFSQLIRHNGLVLVVCFLFALIYRHGGMLLVLAWNASRWGVIFSYIARFASVDYGENGVYYLLRTVAAILPHLALEAVAYILAAMSGVFLSKAFEKYELRSDRFRIVLDACVRIAFASILTLAAAAVVESWVTPLLVAALF